MSGRAPMAAMAPGTPAIDNTMGAQLIGVLLAATLFGVSCIQYFYYFSWYPADRWQLRYLVAACLLFDTGHQALISHTIYIYVIKNFGNPAILGQLVWSLIVEVLFNAFVTVLVQAFYVFRIWRLSDGNYFLTVPVLLLVLSEFGAALAYVIQGMQLQTFEQLAHLKPLSIVVNVLAAAGDVLIAAILCVMLHTSRTGFKKSDSMIHKLIIFVVNTGLLTSTCALGSLISIVVWPNAFIYICFYFTLGRLYTNSLLAMLNARRSIREKVIRADDGFSMQTFTRSHGSGSGSSAITRSPVTPKSASNLAVRVETTKEWRDDTEDMELVFRMPMQSLSKDDLECNPDDSTLLRDSMTTTVEPLCQPELVYNGRGLRVVASQTFRLGAPFRNRDDRVLADSDDSDATDPVMHGVEVV